MGLSQTAAAAAEIPAAPLFSGFVNLLKSETDCKEIILPADCPVAGETKAFAQPQQRLKTSDRATRRRETAQTSHFRHHLFEPEVVAFDHLLQVL